MNSIDLNGYECFGAAPIPEADEATRSLPPELKSVLTPPSSWQLWVNCLSILAALQTAVSLVTLSAFERIVMHYTEVPVWIMFFAFVMLAAGEILVFGICGQIFEVHVRKILFNKTLLFGVLIDFKNVKTSKKYLNMGGISVLMIFVSAFTLMWHGYSISQEKNWSAAFNVLLATAIIGNNLNRVMQPYLNCSALEDSLISLPKFLEKDPRNIKAFLSDCQVLPEKAVYARLCDLINIQEEACLRATIDFARSSGVKSTNPVEIMLELRRSGNHSAIAALTAAQLEARKSRPISFSQLRDCGEEGKEIRGPIEGKKRRLHTSLFDFFTKKFGFPMMENDKYAYRIFNSSKDADSIIMGPYASLLVSNDQLYWLDDELDKSFRSRGGVRALTTFNAQLMCMLLALLAVAGFSFLTSVYNISLKISDKRES